ncbi:MAG: TRAP transporter small permease subunit [Pseudomonadota bacterium]
MPDASAPGLLRRINLAYARFLSALLAVSVLIIVVPVSLQIFSRYTPLVPHYIWTEELARFLLVWMVMIGAMLCLKEGSHFIVDVFPVLSPKPAAVMDLVSGTFVMIFAATFFWYGIEFTEFAWFRISELAEMPLWLIHIAWPILGFTWMIFNGERMLNAVATLRGRA